MYSPHEVTVRAVIDLMGSLSLALAERYTIEREIGQGAMAIIYAADDLKHHRKVAVKVLRPELSASVGANRFLREIQVAAGLTHPNIVPLHDSGMAGDFLFYVMPLAESASLRVRLLRQPQLPLEEALEIAHEVAAGLSFAHHRGIVHRDIKPENILLVDGHALIADFGIAQALCAGCGDNITIDGAVLGTPGYMSPEQGMGDNIDPQTDVYSLGCTLYEMLAGRPTFMGNSLEETVALQATGSVTPLRELRPDAPEAVEQAVHKALAVSRAHRFATTAEFADAVKLSSAHVILANTGSLETLRRPAPSRGLQWLTVLLAVFFLGGVGWLGYDRWNGNEPGRLESLAVLPLVNLAGDPGQDPIVDGMTESLITNLARTGLLTVTSRTSVMLYRDSKKSLPEIAEELDVGLVVEGSVLQIGERVRIDVQLIEAATDGHLWANSYEWDLLDVLELQREVTRAIVAEIRDALSAADSSTDESFRQP